MKRRTWPIRLVLASCCLLGCRSDFLGNDDLEPPSWPSSGSGDLEALGPGHTTINYVNYERLVIDEPVTFEIGLRGPPATYAVHYEVRDGIRDEPADAIPLTDSWASNSGTLNIDKDSYQDQAVTIIVPGPTIPGVYSFRLWVDAADGGPFPLSSAPADIGVMVDNPPVSDADVETWQLRTEEGTTISTRQALAEAFAPILLLGAGESYHPQSVESALEQAILRVDGAIVDWQYGSVPGLIGRHTRLNATVEFRTFIEVDPEDVVFYASIHRTERGLAVGYWFFYAFNDWRTYTPTGNDHQGDWEGVVVLFDGDDPALWAAGPSRIAVAQHEQYANALVQLLRNVSSDDPDGVLGAIDADQLDGGQVADWNAGELQRVGDHPLVYASLGSHATYFSSEPVVFTCDAIDNPNGDGSALLPPGVLVSDLPVEHLDWIRSDVVVLPSLATITAGSPFEWMRFTGRWGSVVDNPRGAFGDVNHPGLVCALSPLLNAGNDGPTSPIFRPVVVGEGSSPSRRWLDPHGWADGMDLWSP